MAKRWRQRQQRRRLKSRNIDETKSAQRQTTSTANRTKTERIRNWWANARKIEWTKNMKLENERKVKKWKAKRRKKAFIEPNEAIYTVIDSIFSRKKEKMWNISPPFDASTCFCIWLFSYFPPANGTNDIQCILSQKNFRFEWIEWMRSASKEWKSNRTGLNSYFEIKRENRQKKNFHLNEKCIFSFVLLPSSCHTNAIRSIQTKESRASHAPMKTKRSKWK